ncbi:hypothetical protein HTZ77_32135 [Nonomuraea sp. SMC257]|uniref:Uncharacterized protein n=1 Tax=Nonomuraea montanisoli TaxID=2741721 RepID=A0A7Y6M765_9ACTN|nr:hypothetical protein [Nonomuraea montanisoli]NUW36034.1 hypothetical protein [Nonomuraea montanisoli]
MRLDDLSPETLAGGGQDLSAFALEVLRAEGRGKIEVSLPEAGTLAETPRNVQIANTEIDLARGTLRSLRGAVRDALEMQERHRLSTAERTDFATLVGALRGMLEGLFRQPLRFPGEERAGATTPNVKQTVTRVRGTLTGLRSPWARGLAADIDQEIKIIEPGGSVIGIDLTR